MNIVRLIRTGLLSCTVCLLSFSNVDRERGRTYKLKYKDADAERKMILNATDADGLLQTLQHHNPIWRLTTQRLLVQSGNKSVLPELYSDWKPNTDQVSSYVHVSGFRNRLRNIRLETFEAVGKAEPVAALKVDQTITINVVKNVMKFDKELITLQAGTNVNLVLNNPDFMQHNLVVIKPNTTQKVGEAADKMAADPDGAKLNYVPKMPEVLFATPLVNPEEKYTLKFKVPTIPGDYPFLCTFPGHWRIMKGIMRVTK